MAAPTTLPDALAEIEELRGQVRDLLCLLKQEAEHDRAEALRRRSDPEGIDAPEKATAAQDSLEQPDGRQQGKPVAPILRDLPQVIGAIPDVIFQLDLQGNLAGWNIRLETVTGFTPQELNGRPALSFVPEQEHAQTAAAIRRAFEDGYAELEGHLLTKDGRTISYHWTGAALKNEKGIAIGIAGVGRDISERKKIESALRTSEERLRLAMDIAQLATWEWDIRTNKVIWSENCEQVKQLPPGTFDGTFDAYQRLVLPEDRPRLSADIQSALNGNSAYHTEHRIAPPGGEVQWIEGNGAVFRDEMGRPIRMVGTARNITERKQAEQSLRLSQERYARATAIGKVGVWELDAVTGLYHGDVNLKALFGYAPDELSTDPYVWLGLVHPEDQSIALKAWEGIVSGSTDDYYYELRMIRKNGGIIWTDVRGHAERDEHGHVQRLIGATVDITERKQTDTALRISQMKLRQALEASNIGLWDWNTATNEAVFSLEWKRQLGYEPHEIAGHLAEWESRLHPEDRDRALAYARAYLVKPEGDYAQEFRLRHKDGSYRWIAARASFAPEPDGKRIRLLGSHIDITESKRAEETLRLTQFFVDRAVDGVLWVAPDGRILSVNEAACRMLEYSSEELTAMTVHDIDPHFPPEAWPAHWEELKQKGSMTFESKHWSSTGRVLDTEVTVNYLCYGGNEYNCAIMRDVGERKRAEADLRRSHTFLRQVIDTDPNFIFAKDRDGRFTLVNKAIAEAYGTTVDNLLGKTDADFNPNQDEVASFVKKDLEVLDSLQERFISEEKITDAAGQIRWLQTVKRPLLDDTGRATMVLGASTDITARKGVEQALRRRESDLHAAIAERERISEDLHDGILQSIYAIGLGLEACRPLIAEQPKKSATKLNAELQRTIGQLNHVLEEVRNFIAGLESHILDGQEFDVVLRAMVHALAASYSIPFRVTVEKAAVQYLSTEQAYHIMNVAREALSNSFRHSHARRITLSLKCLRRAVRLSVTDNGVGFNPSAVGGAGHGLANMASRARKIGGNFTLLSKPRGGTKIVLDLPMRCTDACY